MIIVWILFFIHLFNIVNVSNNVHFVYVGYSINPSFSSYEHLNFHYLIYFLTSFLCKFQHLSGESLLRSHWETLTNRLSVTPVTFRSGNWRILLLTSICLDIHWYKMYFHYSVMRKKKCIQREDSASTA